ncbi:MAG: hypothetical protein J6U93_00355 [Alistipes sp.]|nr:hypothetical protein [Alistipes sp.]
MLGKILTRLFALLGMSLTCVACYACPDTEFNPNFEASGRVVDPEGEPIEGIHVSTDLQGSFTNKSGEFRVVGRLADIYFSDDDGELNGGEFQPHQIELPTDQSWAEEEIKVLDLGDVKLSRVNEE